MNEIIILELRVNIDAYDENALKGRKEDVIDYLSTEDSGGWEVLSVKESRYAAVIAELKKSVKTLKTENLQLKKKNKETEDKYNALLITVENAYAEQTGIAKKELLEKMQKEREDNAWSSILD